MKLGTAGLLVMIGAILLALFVIDPITLSKGILLVVLFLIGLGMCLEAGSREKN